jgi:AraC-like DNA-binding protein
LISSKNYLKRQLFHIPQSAISRRQPSEPLLANPGGLGDNSTVLSIPLIHRSALGPAVSILDEIGAPTSRLLERHHLPTIDAETPHGFVPILDVWEFVDAASSTQGILDFGFLIAERVSIKRVGRWGARVANAITLQHAIDILSQSIRLDVPNVQIGLEKRNGSSWFWRDHKPERRHMAGYWIGEQYILGLMIQVVRMVAGPHWRPKQIEVQSRSLEWGGSRPDILGDAQIEFCAQRTAFEVPARWLGAHVLQQRDPVIPTATQNEELPPTDLAGSLHCAVKSLILEQRPSLALAAEIMRSSERTVRRHLAAEGTSWREILEAAEAETAFELIGDSGNSLADIAAALNYTQYAHFYRAFRRWTGESPSVYRQNLESA